MIESIETYEKIGDHTNKCKKLYLIIPFASQETCTTLKQYIEYLLEGTSTSIPHRKERK